MDDYVHVPHTDPRFNNVRGGWQGESPMPHEKAEIEHVYFCGSDCSNNNHGFNMHPERVYSEVAREVARRRSLNASGIHTSWRKSYSS